MSKKGKGGRKKQQTKEVKDTIPEVDKEFYELQIQDLNQKLARLRARCSELEEECEDTKKALQKLDEDRADIIAYLKRTLQAKTDEIVELQERLTALQQARETEKEMFIEKIRNMENDFKMMHEQLTSEIKLLNGKLNSLEEFRSQREELMNKFLTQETAMAEQEKRHKQTLYEVERKFIIAKDELKKDMESKLLQLSLDFQNATQMRIAATTQRVIRENVAVNNELASLMESWRQMTDEVVSLKDKNKTMRMEIELHKDEKLQCLKRNEIQTRVIDKISAEHETLLMHYNKMTHFENRSETLEKQLIEVKNEFAKQEALMQKTMQLLHFSETERSDLQRKLYEAFHEISKLDGVLVTATKVVMDCAILEKSEGSKPDDIRLSTQERSSLLQTLLDLFNSVELRKQADFDLRLTKSVDTITGPVAFKQVYERGDLGIITKHGQSTSS